MAQLKLKKIIDAPLSEVWTTWDAFGDIHTFHPDVENSHLLAGSQQTGNGAKRRCDFVGGKNHVLEEIVEYEPEKRLKVKIFDGNVPIKVAYVTFSFRSLGPNRTEIVTEADFEMKMGLFGKLLSPVMRKQLEKGLGNLLNGNAEHMSGQPRAA